MKKALLVLALCLFTVSAFAQDLYVGSIKSNKYHYLDCKFAKRIETKNLRYFSSPEEAIKSGYYPCRICRPPILSEDDNGR
jgi:micrococcal nuclease